ncbi:glycosyltransferase family 39 protein [Cellulomonas fengjieae]|uniref:DUF6311 domain-containing protein n=1 Tax=Cellulomonas fengjieae TaxID=2819978 RepID=A0ABS3SDW6_9CELL|nr:glycosyltransferase family 39 protein [Cellulomonas fengjieae]MBO3083837.1 hypothetical protein [Cellulomonas fengjieae]MBO3101414.1 hypothetical protein [Cellulomonas fengjieae]QVI64877.1 hypothetical protein KG102_12005 [Cellulomonas fengjieae]
MQSETLGLDADVTPPQRVPLRSRARARTARALRRDGHLWPTVTLVLWIIVCWARPILRDPRNLRLSNPGDSESFAYYLSWNVHALTNLEDPFFAPNLYAPEGLDLGNAISVPAVSILVSPISAAFGGTAGYNAAILLSILFAGLAVYLLARELTGSVVGGTLAGALMVVSPYVTGHSLSHLNLMWVFGLPLLAYLVVRAVRGTLRRRWLVVWTAAIVAFTLGASTELMVTESVFALVALVIALVVVRGPARATLLRTVPWLALGAVIGAIVASPVIAAGLSSGIPESVANPPSLYSSDLTNVVVPTEQLLVGDSFFADLRTRWLGNGAENTAYLPFTLLLLVLASAIARPSRLQAGVGAFAAVALLFSFGPVLNIAGSPTVPLPWRLAELVPGLDHALPARFSAFVFMALAVLVAEAWARRALPRWFVGGCVAISAVLLLPNLAQLGFPTDAHEPPFVTDGAIKEVVEPGDNVLVLPAGQWGPGMRWQDTLDFSFDMPTGNGGGAQAPEALSDPVGWALYNRDLEFDYAGTLPEYLQEYDVDTVIVDGTHPAWDAVVSEALGTSGRQVGGVHVYDVP